MAPAEAWSSVASEYTQWAKDLTQPYARHALEAARLPHTQPLKVLDVACGGGALTNLVAEGYPESSVLATDFAEGMVELVKKNAVEKGWRNVEAKVMDAMALDIPDATFDAAFCIFGVMLMPSGTTALSELHRVLKPNGVAAFTTWGPQDVTQIMFKALHRVRGSAAAAPMAGWADMKGWGHLDFAVEKLREVGFGKVEGTTVTRTVTFTDTPAYFEMMVRNPGVRDFMQAQGLTEDETGAFIEAAKEITLEKFEGQEVRMTSTANLVVGWK
ncbi:hypothetical protein HK104_001784 [Borealophlyctis nickersoniae]|nr:hypothetical protein HK104_001784 [Borealophlyctis nickersoniae]